MVLAIHTILQIINWKLMEILKPHQIYTAGSRKPENINPRPFPQVCIIFTTKSNFHISLGLSAKVD